MQDCVHCRVKILGNHTVCPLCSGILEGKKDPDEDVFPIYLLYIRSSICLFEY